MYVLLVEKVNPGLVNAAKTVKLEVAVVVSKVE
jgi:hypothetical protein